MRTSAASLWPVAEVWKREIKLRTQVKYRQYCWLQMKRKKQWVRIFVYEISLSALWAILGWMAKIWDVTVELLCCSTKARRTSTRIHWKNESKCIFLFLTHTHTLTLLSSPLLSRLPLRNLLPLRSARNIPARCVSPARLLSQLIIHLIVYNCCHIRGPSSIFLIINSN